MAKETVEKKAESKVAVVSLSDYITKIGNELSGPDKVKAALCLLYTECKVIDRIERKGEEYYIVEK
jgi:hypothetical protein